MSFPELLQGLGKWEASIPDDPMARQFAHIKRGPDGKFNDDDLVKILNDAIEQPAGPSALNKSIMKDSADHFRRFRSQQCPRSSESSRDSWHATSSQVERGLVE